MAREHRATIDGPTTLGVRDDVCVCPRRGAGDKHERDPEVAAQEVHMLDGERKEAGDERRCDGACETLRELCEAVGGAERGRSGCVVFDEDHVEAVQSRSLKIYRGREEVWESAHEKARHAMRLSVNASPMPTQSISLMSLLLTTLSDASEPN